MTTAHLPVLVPVLLVCICATASVIVDPCTSAGPRRYLIVPVSSQVMSGSSTGAAFAPEVSTWSHVNASYSACSSGVIHARSEPSVGVAVGVASSVGVSVGVGVAVSLGSA